MKTIILTILLLFTNLIFSQDNVIDEPTLLRIDPINVVDLHLNITKPVTPSRNNDVRVGPIMLLGGSSFVLAGLLTPPIMEGGSTTQKKPFFQQGGRMAAIISGSLVFTIGIGVSLGGY